MPDGLRQVESEDTTHSSDTDDSTETSRSNASTTRSETRWELGIFARKVTTTSTTPPEYRDPPDG